jgi:hypothetical protein
MPFDAANETRVFCLNVIKLQINKLTFLLTEINILLYMARSWLSKKEALSFAAYCHSDERRLKLQKECAAKVNAGTINPMPWSVLERIVTEEDFQHWKEHIQNK